MTAFLGTFAANCLNVLVTLLTSIFTARVLLPSGRGELAEILLWGNLFLSLGMLALPTSVTMLQARARSDTTLASSALAAACGLSGLVAVVFLVCTPALAKAELLAPIMLFGALIIPSGLIGQTLLAVDHGLDRIDKLNLLRLLPSAFYALACIALWMLDGVSAAAFAAANLAASLAVALYKLQEHWAAPRARPSLGMMTEMLVAGLSMHGGALLSLALARADQIYVAFRLTSVDLGLYAVALTVGSVASGVLVGAVQTVALPRLASACDAATRREIVRLALVTTFVGGLGVALAVAATSPVLVPLVFGVDFERSATLASILALSQVPATYVSVASLALRTGGDWITGSMAPAIGMVVLGLCLDLASGPLCLETIASSLVLSWSAACVFVIARVRAATDLPLLGCLWPTAADAAAVVAHARART